VRVVSLLAVAVAIIASLYLIGIAAAQEGPAPPAPDIDDIVVLGSDSVRITWTQETSPDLNRTIVHYSDIPELMIPAKLFKSPHINVAIGTDLTVKTISGLAEGTTYHFMITAESITGATSYSDLVSVDIPATPPEITVSSGVIPADSLVMVEGEASDDQGVLSVRFRIDDGAWRDAAGTTNWAFFVDTTGLGGGDHNITILATDGAASREVTVRVESSGPPSGGSTATPVPVHFYGLIGLLTFLAVLALSQSGIYLIFAAFGLMYAKVTGRKVLNNYVRGKIHGYIIANPGDHYSGIMRKLGLKNGLFAYHVKVLERESLVKSIMDGRFRRFYPIGMKVEESIEMDTFQLRILNLISDNPGISQKEICQALGARKQMVNLNVRAMFHEGLIDVVKEGRQTHCYLIAPDDDVEEI